MPERYIQKNLSTHPSKGYMFAASQMCRLNNIIGTLTVDETSSIFSANDFADQIK